MQNRNVIKMFAVLFSIVCLYQLSFTWVANGVEEDAVAYAADFDFFFTGSQSIQKTNAKINFMT